MDRRRSLTETMEDDEMQWIAIDDFTLSEEQKVSKNYEQLAQYSENICYMEFPAGTTVETQNTSILGNYCLYYSSIKPVNPYKHSVLVHNKMISDNLYITESGNGIITGIAYSHQMKSILREKNGNELNITFGFTAPSGTRIRIFAK